MSSWNIDPLLTAAFPSFVPSLLSVCSDARVPLGVRHVLLSDNVIMKASHLQLCLLALTYLPPRPSSNCPSRFPQDTEFPGVVARPVGSFASHTDFQYQTLRCNVDLLKIIQLGLTFSDKVRACTQRSRGDVCLRPCMSLSSCIRRGCCPRVVAAVLLLLWCFF